LERNKIKQIIINAIKVVLKKERNGKKEKKKKELFSSSKFFEFLE